MDVVSKHMFRVLIVKESLLKYMSMFECMEIDESIYEGVV